MTLSEELQWRGFINQTTFDDVSELDKETRTFYMGFDASADSQTVGNLAAMMFIWTFMRHGYDPIILAGGSTSLIGDPKDTSERQLQDEETIAHNTECAKKQIEKIFHGEKFRMVNNLDWTRDVKVLDFLRDIGKHFSMTNLIQRDFIAARIGEGGSGISYAEFSYTLLQGLDYLHLHDAHGVTLQLGGSDQWGNCLSGVELIRKARGKEVHVVTLNLVIDKSTGRKFGKSEDGAVWLDEKKTSPFKFYQFWINADDSGAEDYLKIYTRLDKSAVDGVMEEHMENPGLRRAQKRLAFEVTAIVHGIKRAESVRRVSDVLFGLTEYKDLEKEDFEVLADELPVVEANIGETMLVEVLVDAALASSKTEARRFLDASAVYINGAQFSLDKQMFDLHDSLHGFAVVRRGKNASALVKLKG